MILARRGDLSAAIQCFETAARAEPDYHKAHHNLAMGLLMAGEAARALVAIERALALRDDDRDSVLLAAEILDRLGRRDDARQTRTRGAHLPAGNWSERAVIE